jgi:hypothetical protein
MSPHPSSHTTYSNIIDHETYGIEPEVLWVTLHPKQQKVLASSPQQIQRENIQLAHHRQHPTTGM